MSQAWTAFPNWYPDPLGRHQWRWYDGATWTEHVASHGYQGIDHLAPPGPPAAGGWGPTATWTPQPVPEPAPSVPTAEVPARILPAEPEVSDLREARVLLVDLLSSPPGGGDRTPDDVVIRSQHGARLGAVRLLPDPVARITRLLTAVDPTTSARLQLLGRDGGVLLTVARPARHLRVRIKVSDGAGAEVGELVAQEVVGRVCYRLEAGGEAVGTVEAPHWRSWQIEAKDHRGASVARISRTWEVVAPRHFIPPDTYVVQLHQPVPEPLRSLVLAALLTVETALRPTPAHR